MTTVLIVDGAAPSRKQAVEVIGAIWVAWDVLEADNAEEALVLARAAPVDLALIDLETQGHDGLVLANELIGINPDTRLAYAAVTVETEAADRWEALGAIYVAKPLQPATLASTLGGLQADRD